MTREEAIWWVNHLFEIRKEEYFNKRMMEDAKEVEEAQRMAIEALTYQNLSKPNNTCEVDLIRREDAIEAVEKAKTARSADGEIFCAKINAQMNIQHLPPIQPERRKGERIEVVRCKDCKHMKHVIDKGKNGICGALGALIIMNGNDYCSYGERREE